MNLKLRRFFNLPNKDESEIINKQTLEIKAMAKKESSEYFLEEYNTQKKRDSICPNCRSTNIVDKISRVQGNVSGSFVWGSGSLSGESDTNEVNHCNGCGNQWKKYKTNYQSEKSFLVKWLDGVDVHIEGKYDFGEKYVEMLKNFYAESILVIFKSVSDDCYSSAEKNITMKSLRKIFKSVYDKKS